MYTEICLAKQTNYFALNYPTGQTDAGKCILTTPQKIALCHIQSHREYYIP